MFARVKELTKPKQRQLITSCIYGAYTVLAVTNLIVNGSDLGVFDLAIIVPGITMLGAAVAQSIGRGIHALTKDDHTVEATQQENDNKKLIIRDSTHRIVNACLHIGASSCYMAYDALILAKIAPFPASATLAGIACREAGSAFWDAAAWISLFHAIEHDRKQENHPDADVKALGIHPSIYNLSNEILFLIACGLYAAEIFSETPLNKIRATAIFLWGTANVIGLISASHDVYTRNDPKTTAAVVVSPDEENQEEYVVQVSSTEESETSSDQVVIASPGM